MKTKSDAFNFMGQQNLNTTDSKGTKKVRIDAIIVTVLGTGEYGQGPVYQKP